MKVDIIVPIYNAFDDVRVCIESVIQHTDLSNHRLLLINDRSTDSRILPFLKQTIEDNKSLNIVLKENIENLGFVGTVNVGMGASENDVVLLNSDTKVTARWLEKIQKCAYSKNGVATVTPLSNNATLASVPDFLIENEIPADTTLDEYANIIEDCSMRLYPEIPTANGFCMYIKREAINIVGAFDEKNFGMGYGEENDFCYRCLQIGYRHLLCDDTFIYHKGSQSFKEERKLLAQKHLSVLKTMYPDHFLNTDLFQQKNPIFPIQANVRYGYGVYKKKNILVLIHVFQDPPIGSVGGASMHVYDLVKNLLHLYNFHVLYYSEANSAYFVTSYFDDATVTNYLGACPKYTSPNLYNDTFKEYLLRSMDLLGIDLIHVHHLLDLYLDVFPVAQSKGIPVVFSIHDYYTLCPSINLMDIDKRPCNFYETRDCKRCATGRWGCKGDFMMLWQKECHSCLETAKKIIAPSEAAKEIFQSFYKDLDVDVIEHGYRPGEVIRINRQESSKTFNIAFIGGMSEIKGLSYLKGLKEKVRGTDIVIHLFGMTRDSMVNVSSKNFVYHGQYVREELLKRLRESDVKLICLFSICAETFSYTLSESLLAGIPVITLDIGAIAERVRKIDAGWVMPYDCSMDDIYRTIGRIKTDSMEYISKVENIKRYLKHAKSTEDMAHEYSVIYDGLIRQYPVSKNYSDNISEKRLFYQNLKSPLLINENNIFSIQTEFLRLKNLIIKGDAPLSVAIAEVKKFRSLAKGSHLRNKIVYKLIWYRFVYKYVMCATIGVWENMKRFFR